jgi:dihydrodipicolinate synthase/N-acetylneuraminate lyase
VSAPTQAVSRDGSVTKVTGFLPPIATPFLDGRVDLDSLKRLLDDLVDHVSGILVGGSVGEAASLTLEERVLVMNTVAEHIGRDRYLAVSISDNAIETSRRLSEAAGEAGADLLMVSCPNYYTNDGPMLEAYFGALSEFASADICLYDNPIASHTALSVADIAALAAAAPRLTHVKVTDTTIEKVEALRRDTSLVVHSGDDIVLWHQLTRGAEGAMVALPMIYPEHASALWRAFSDGDLPAAYEQYRHVTNFIQISLGGPDYVAVVKTVLHHRGLIASPEARLPLVAPTSRRRAEVIASL